jgi:hypothetical protein
MFWQAMDGNGGVQWGIEKIGFAWAFNVACCAVWFAVIGVVIGFWRFRVSLKDVQLDQS